MMREPIDLSLCVLIYKQSTQHTVKDDFSHFLRGYVEYYLVINMRDHNFVVVGVSIGGYS